MPSNASAKFVENSREVEYLSLIHKRSGGESRGRRKPELEVLNKSAVVLITACWEAYVEDVAREAFGFMLKNAPRPAAFTSIVRELAAKPLLRKGRTESRIWKLAGEGWRVVLRLHCDRVLKQLHSPKSNNVDEVFFHLLGLRKVSNSWNWPRMSAEAARLKLDKYVDIRLKIAHRASYPDPVQKWWAKDYQNHVTRLAGKTDRVLSLRIRQRIGTPPWV